MINKKAETGIEQIFIGFLTVVIVLGFLSILPSILNPCTQEKSQISDLTGKLSSCSSQLVNQTELANNLNNQCNQKITNATEKCDKDLEINIDIVNSYRTMFVIYHITIALIFVLGFNLFFHMFKIEFNFDFGHRVNQIIKVIKHIWIAIKWILFVLSCLLLIFIIVYLLFPRLFY